MEGVRLASAVLALSMLAAASSVLISVWSGPVARGHTFGNPKSVSLPSLAANGRFEMRNTSGIPARGTFVAGNLNGLSSTPRGPIVIESDSEFTARNGVVGGSGTPADPYIIQGWDIDATYAQPAISIHATRAWFVVRDVTMSHVDDGYRAGGIVLDDVENGRLENISLGSTSLDLSVRNSAHVHLAGVELGSNAALGVVDSTDISIIGTRALPTYPSGVNVAVGLVNVTGALVANSVVASGLGGIEVFSSYGVTIENNTISRAGTGVLAYSQNGGMTIRNNTLFDNGDGDIRLVDSTSVTIRGNRLSSNRSTEAGLVVQGYSQAHYDSHDISADNLVAGLPLVVAERCSGLALNGTQAGQIYIAGCKDVEIANITMAVAGTQLALMFVDRATVRDSTFRNSSTGGATTGVLLRETSNSAVFHNNFIHAGAWDQSGTNNTWDDGYPAGGNYHWDYLGVDSNGDGIGDDPEPIPENAIDRYPLMRPVGLPLEPPIVRLIIAPTTIVTQAYFNFDGSASWDPDGRIVIGHWDFGDGTTFPYVFPGISSGSYTYDRPGTYTVTLTVTDNSGLTGSDSKTIVVVPNTPPLPAPLAFTVRESASGFRVPVPSDWTVSQNVDIGGTYVELVAVGTEYNGHKSGLAVDVTVDPNVRETREYLNATVQASLNDLRNSDPSAVLSGGLEFRQIANHSAVVLELWYSSDNVFEKIAVVVSEAHEQSWDIVLVFDGALPPIMDPAFETIISGFVITSSPIPRISPLSNEVLVPVAIVLITGVALSVLGFVFLHPRRPEKPWN